MSQGFLTPHTSGFENECEELNPSTLGIGESGKMSI
jgi:hypothetical protein